MIIITQMDDDLVLATASGSGMIGVVVPPELHELPVERLRYDGAQIIDAATITNWHIDSAGQKRLNATADRQALACAFADELINDNGVWRVKTQADDLRKYLKEKRRQMENAGVVVSGVKLPTDINTRTTISLIVGKLSAGQMVEPINFVLNGAGVAATQVMFESWDAAITSHVQVCFDVQASLLADIDSALITTTAQVDAANWPTSIV